jgi:glyoxylase-like metal-dependent hydrolase (beta-lactamase superfamily II)
MEVAKGVRMLKIAAAVMGKPSVIYPVLLTEENATILIDAGFPGQFPQINEAIEKVNGSLTELQGIMLTHHDIDHIGSVSAIQKELGKKIEVAAHREEIAFIQGEKTPVKIAQLETRLNYLPEEMKETYRRLKSGFQNSIVKVDKVLTDSEKLPYCGGITVIHTPGHTPGHMSLYLGKSKILIAGDLFFVENNRLVKTPEPINDDNEAVLKSIKKLTDYDISKVICYHGGLFEEEANKRIAILAEDNN